MSDALTCWIASACCTLLLISTTALAEQGAWGGNGGWWGQPREWEGDLDGPGHHAVYPRGHCPQGGCRAEDVYDDHQEPHQVDAASTIPGAGFYFVPS